LTWARPSSDPAKPPYLAERDDDGAPGRRVALRGFNLSGGAKLPASRGLPFSRGPDRDVVARAQRFLPRLAADGFDLLRIPIVWEFFAPYKDREPPEATVAEIRRLVDFAGSLGFWVIVDVHQDLMGSYFARPDKPTWHGDGFPSWLLRQAYSDGGEEDVPRQWVDSVWWVPFFHHWALNYRANRPLLRVMRGLGRASVRDSFERFAGHLASMFRGLGNVLTFEVFNEPLSTCTIAADHIALAQAFVRGLGDAVSLRGTPTCSVMPAGDWLDGAQRVIRLPQIDTRRASILGRSSLPDGPLQARPGGERFWLATPHFYDARADAPLLHPQPERYEAAVATAERLLGTWGVVPIVGEFGCGNEKAGAESLRARWIDCFEKRAWSWCLWNFNPDAGRGGDDHWCAQRYSVAEGAADGDVRFGPSYYALLRPFPRRLAAPVLSTQWNGRRYEATFGRAPRPGWCTEIHVPASLGAFEAVGAREVRDRLVIVGSEAAKVSVTIECHGHEHQPPAAGP
jgi:hypothetical protein